MRTTKRLTPTVIARFLRQGRGEGTYADYIPWHRVTRGDPASSGRSHLLMWRGRLRELLSDGELGEQQFATMLPDLDDCVEQCRLTTEDSAHLLTAYGERDPSVQLPGTVELCRQLGIKHPKVASCSFSERPALARSANFWVSITSSRSALASRITVLSGGGGRLEFSSSEKYPADMPAPAATAA